MRLRIRHYETEATLGYGTMRLRIRHYETEATLGYGTMRLRIRHYETEATLGYGTMRLRIRHYETEATLGYGTMRLRIRHSTTTIASGIETNELEDSVPPSPATSASSLVEVEDAEDVDGSVAITPTVKQRRDLLQMYDAGLSHTEKRQIRRDAKKCTLKGNCMYYLGENGLSMRRVILTEKEKDEVLTEVHALDPLWIQEDAGQDQPTLLLEDNYQR
ncbi:unnamed protein product [Arctogadus glacialis]